MLTDVRAKDVFDELTEAKILLLEIVDAYGDRGYHGDKLFTRNYQPELIQRAMDVVGVEIFGKKQASA